MKLKKPCHIGGLSWAKVLSIALLFVLLLYPNGMTGKALIQEESHPRGIVTRGGALRTPGMERGRATPETVRNDRNYIHPLSAGAENPNFQATRLPAGLNSDIVAGDSLQDGPGKLYLPLIFKNFDPALYAIVPNVQGLTQSEAEFAIQNAQLKKGAITQGTSPTVPAGRVRSQTPSAGLYVVKGTAVNLVISTGPAWVNVPDVVGHIRRQLHGLTLDHGAGEQIADGVVAVGRHGNAARRAVVAGEPVAGEVLEIGPDVR